MGGLGMGETKEIKKHNGILKFIVKYPKVILGVMVVLVLGVGVIGIKDYVEYKNKTTKIGFEDIGELATQSAICTEIHVTDDWRKMFGKINIPFTQSKYIYSCDYEVKAGFDFGEITWNEKDKVITVKLPKAKVLSNTLVQNSFKIYHESESKFNQITLEENSAALDGLQEQAEKDAIANGLLDKARSNAETVLTAFFGNAYDLKEYKLKFVDK